MHSRFYQDIQYFPYFKNTMDQINPKFPETVMSAPDYLCFKRLIARIVKFVRVSVRIQQIGLIPICINMSDTVLPSGWASSEMQIRYRQRNDQSDSQCASICLIPSYHYDGHPVRFIQGFTEKTGQDEPSEKTCDGLLGTLRSTSNTWETSR